MFSQITCEIRKCESFQEMKDKMGRIQAPLQSFQPIKPLEILSLDVAVPIKTSSDGNKYILGFIDKFVRLIPIKDISSQTIIKAIYNEWISLFGTPEIIHTDNASYFRSKEMKDFCEYWNIFQKYSSPYYPQGNGTVERLFRTVKSRLACSLYSRVNKKWSTQIKTIEMGINFTKQEVTSYSPFEILYGMKPRLGFSELERTNVIKIDNKRKIRKSI